MKGSVPDPVPTSKGLMSSKQNTIPAEKIVYD
jgi:hypothetical protein